MSGYSAPAIAFAVTCGNRLEHLKQTLPRNLRDNRYYPNLKIVLLDYGSSDSLGAWIATHFTREITAGRLIYYRHDAPHFRMAHAKNMAHRLAIDDGAQIIASLDADNFTGAHFASYVAQKFEAAAEDHEAIFLRARENHGGPGPDTANRMPWGCGGRIVVTANAFLQAGGYDEQFNHWSPDDKDFSRRLINLGFTRHGIHKRHLCAIQHEDDIRFQNFAPGCPATRKEAAGAFSLKGREKLSTVNHGRYGMGSVRRNFGSAPIEFGPLPTRIFGIGMHKTATTSLAAALRRLGFETGHWESPIWARNIINEVTAWKRSLTLEAHYALVDMPMPYLFRELDRCYRGSKFILTIRDEDAWLRSMRTHWDLYYATDWDEDGYSHEMHRRMYGQAEFDAGVMLARYRQHNADVLEHFRDRPDDLLVMDMSAGAGWSALCPFVGRQIPIEPYPVEFVSADRQSYP